MLKVTSAFWVVSSTEVASMVNWDAEVMPVAEPEIWQELPELPAVTSTHEAELAEICAEPDLTAQVTWLVAPLST